MILCLEDVLMQVLELTVDNFGVNFGVRHL